MKNTLLLSLIVTLILQVSGFFSFSGVFVNLFNPEVATAQSPGLPIYTVYRDIVGGENIGATAQSLSWDKLVSENAEIPLTGGATDFDLSVGGHYLVMYSVPIRSTGGSNRSEVQSWLQLNSSSDMQYGYASSYIRRANNDFEGYNESAAILDVSAGDTLELRMQKTDSNTATMQRSPNRSGINILKLDDAWDYARVRPSVSQAITTIWNNVSLGTTDELDTGTFTSTGTGLTLKEVGKYIITYNVGAVTTGTDRTNNELRLMLDGVEIDGTRSTQYARAQNGSFTGIASYVGIIETSGVNQLLELEIKRESTLAGTTNDTVVAKSGLTITKIPDGADYVRISETTGGQDMTTAVDTPVTFDTTVEQGIDLQHDGTNIEEIDISASGDYMFFHSIYNSRTGTANGPRENPYLEWQVSGTTVQYGTSGSYNRNANDGDGITNSSHSSAGVILPGLSPGDTVELVETNEATAGPSVYSGGNMAIQGVSLSSLFVGDAYLSQSSYRWRDDSSDFDSDAGWLAAENTDVSNVSKGDTMRLRMKVENPSTVSYNTDTRFEVQWAQTVGYCSSGLSWTSLETASDAWDMVDTSHISPNAETSSSVFLSNVSGNTHLQSEGYHSPSGETILTTASTFLSDTQKEYEFSMVATESALANTSYCFRLYNTQESKTFEVNNYAKLQIGSTPVVLTDVWGEAGKVTAPANGAWTTVTFIGGPYTTPVIVGRTNTYNDGNEALVFESRNITATTADVRLCDSNAGNSIGCQTHAIETIGYIVVDASQTSSVVGVEAGTFTVDESFDTAGGSIVTNYSETFTQIPYIFTSTQTTTGSSPIVTRVSASTLSNFTGGICQQNSSDACNATHGNETYGWISVDPSVNPFFTDMDIGSGNSNGNSWIWTSASFSTTFDSIPVAISQTVTNNGGQDVQIDEIQNISLTGMDFRACELDNDNDCDTHAVDTIRWLAIEEGVFAAEYVLDKTHYRWYENTNAITPTVGLADENMTLLSIPGSKELRLRMLVQNADPELPIGTLALKLQYGSGGTCESVPSWTDVGTPGGGEDFLHFDNAGVTDGTTISSSLLLGGGHVLQSYNESTPTVVNPNPIPVGEWGEWDFSLIDNTGLTSMQYCFRVVTQNNGEIEYSSYAQIDTTDSDNPVITAFSPDPDFLFPIGNFNITYEYSDIGSGIDTTTDITTLQRWNGASWDPNIAGLYISLDNITSTGALYRATGLPYGKYRAGFGISDYVGNNDSISHEFYVDEIEFIISTPEVDIGTAYVANTQYTSGDTLIITVKTVGAAFDVTMLQQTDMDNSGDIIPDWNGTTGYGYEPNPFGTMNSFGTGSIVVNETVNLNVDGDKNTYTYDIKYSVLLDVLENYSAGDYESLLDFRIDFDY